MNISFMAGDLNIFSSFIGHTYSPLEVLKGILCWWSREVAGMCGAEPGLERGEEVDLRSG